MIFFACLEHMTYAERLTAMRATWNGLRAGALWCSIETPNRLWWFDEHTSFLRVLQLVAGRARVRLFTLQSASSFPALVSRTDR